MAFLKSHVCLWRQGWRSRPECAANVRRDGYAHFSTDSVAVVRRLASRGAVLNAPLCDGATALSIALQHGHEGVVHLLGSLGANLDAA